MKKLSKKQKKLIKARSLSLVGLEATRDIVKGLTFVSAGAVGCAVLEDLSGNFGSKSMTLRKGKKIFVGGIHTGVKALVVSSLVAISGGVIMDVELNKKK